MDPGSMLNCFQDKNPAVVRNYKFLSSLETETERVSANPIDNLFSRTQSPGGWDSPNFNGDNSSDNSSQPHSPENGEGGRPRSQMSTRIGGRVSGSNSGGLINSEIKSLCRRPPSQDMGRVGEGLRYIAIRSPSLGIPTVITTKMNMIHKFDRLSSANDLRARSNENELEGLRKKVNDMEMERKEMTLEMKAMEEQLEKVNCAFEKARKIAEDVIVHEFYAKKIKDSDHSVLSEINQPAVLTHTPPKTNDEDFTEEVVAVRSDVQLKKSHEGVEKCRDYITNAPNENELEEMKIEQKDISLEWEEMEDRLEKANKELEEYLKKIKDVENPDSSKDAPTITTSDSSCTSNGDHSTIITHTPPNNDIKGFAEEVTAMGSGVQLQHCREDMESSVDIMMSNKFSDNILMSDIEENNDNIIESDFREDVESSVDITMSNKFSDNIFMSDKEENNDNIIESECKREVIASVIGAGGEQRMARPMTRTEHRRSRSNSKASDIGSREEQRATRSKLRSCQASSTSHMNSSCARDIGTGAEQCTESPRGQSRTSSSSSLSSKSSSNSVVEKIRESSQVEERDYDKQPTILIKLVENKKWKEAVLHCVTHPQEASTWMVRYQQIDGSDTKSNKIARWKILPLHSAIVLHAPLKVITTLVDAYPDSVKIGNEKKMLPLHSAFRVGCKLDIAAFLVDTYPDAIDLKDNKGHTPLHILQAYRRKYEKEKKKNGHPHRSGTTDRNRENLINYVLNNRKQEDDGNKKVINDSEIVSTR